MPVKLLPAASGSHVVDRVYAQPSRNERLSTRSCCVAIAKARSKPCPGVEATISKTASGEGESTAPLCGAFHEYEGFEFNTVYVQH